LGYKGVDYNIGPSPDTLLLNLVNEQEYVITPIWNVIGIINGSLADEVVVLGNHRDAWIAGGAGDPNSGSAALNEVVRGFGEALNAGWKPLRTIVLASWDGEEYGLVGSTEWVEEYLPWLQAATVAYLNVDVGTTGPHFTAAAAPLLNKALIDTCKALGHEYPTYLLIFFTVDLVLSPNQTITNQTVGDVWNGHIRTMGSGSDFTAFQDFAGIPCVDMGFTGGRDTAVYHYHSNYDSFDWMDKYGDPGFHYHATIAKVWALLAAKLIETPVIQLNATIYAKALAGYLDNIKSKAPKFIAEDDEDGTGNPLLYSLTKAIDRLHNVSVSFDSQAQALTDEIEKDPLPWWKWWQKIKLYYAVRRVNAKYKMLERQFLHEPGLDGRSWFKHVVFAPGVWTGYAGATFPGLVESIENNDRGSAFKWAGICTGIVEKAASSLES
jgi:N-acetylated-alpha-linked acidic dipeptidase